MTPTRELATQVMQTMNNLVGRGNIRTAQLIGGLYAKTIKTNEKKS
jgi:superfamily II DNA/RNA helicase